MYRTTRATTAATLLACLTLTAGCSKSGPEVIATGPAQTSAAATSAAPEPSATEATAVDGLSAVEVWKKTKTDADAAKSVHVAARLLDGKELIAINLKLSEAGKAFGTLAFNGDKITVRRLGKTLYFKADRGFWTTNADAATAKALANKWIMVKKGFSKDMEQFFQLTDMDYVVSDMMSLSAAEQQTLKLVPGIDIGRQKTIGLAETDAGQAQLQTLYLSADDPALPLNLTFADSDQFMKFRSWGQDFTVLAPRGAIDLATAG